MPTVMKAKEGRSDTKTISSDGGLQLHKRHAHTTEQELDPEGKNLFRTKKPTLSSNWDPPLTRRKSYPNSVATMMKTS